jgi:hypothetical protein
VIRTVTTPSSTTTAPARFLLLGDSHAGAIGRAAQAAGISFQGGPIGAARDFNAEFFDLRGADPVFRDSEADGLYRGFLSALGVSGIDQLTVPLVLTFGLSAHFFATSENWQLYRGPDGNLLPGFVGSRLCDAIVLAMARDALAFYRHVRGLGLRVLAVLPPQRVPGMSDPVMFMAAQDSMFRALAALDIEIVDLRTRVSDPAGFQRREFCEVDDPIHGNLAFGRLILAELLDRGL